jgi:hypothetical protein
MSVNDTEAFLGVYNHGSVAGLFNVVYDSAHVDGQYQELGYIPNNVGTSNPAANQLRWTGMEAGQAGFGANAFTYGPTIISSVAVFSSVLDTTSNPTTAGSYISLSNSTGCVVAWKSTTVSTAYFHVERLR